MTFLVLPAAPADLDHLMEIQFAAMSQQPYHTAVYPGGNNPAARSAAAARRLPDLLASFANSNADKKAEGKASASTGGSGITHYMMKVVEKLDSGEECILGFGHWKHVLATDKKVDPKKIREDITWAKEGEWQWEAAAMFLEGSLMMRERWVDGREHMRMSRSFVLFLFFPSCLWLGYEEWFCHWVLALR